MLTANTAYVGGTFASIGGSIRRFLAEISLSTGLATAWDPDPNNTVHDIVVSGASVYVGGFFFGSR